jgi:hypothetical protein
MEVSGRQEYKILVRRLCEPQSRSGRFGETNKSLQFRQTQARFFIHEYLYVLVYKNHHQTTITKTAK